MSQKAFDALVQARREALERQVECGWCGQTCKNADHLYFHIILRHQRGKEEVKHD